MSESSRVKLFKLPENDLITLYEEERGIPVRFSALSDPELRKERLKVFDWDLGSDEHKPQFIRKSLESDHTKISTVYQNYYNSGLEPLVITQDFEGEPTLLEIAEDLKLLFNLKRKVTSFGVEYYSEKMSNEPQIIITGLQVSATLNLLQRYQAVRQLDLFLYIDDRSLNQSPHADSSREFRYNSLIYRIDKSQGAVVGYYTRFLGKKYLIAPSVEESKFWPYNN